MDKRIFETYAGLEGRQLLEPILRDFAGRAAVVSSFGAESAVLLHMVAEVDTATPVIFLDTGKHFWETLSYRSKLIDRLGLTGVRIITPDAADLAAQDPDGTLHTANADQCCHIRKTLPLAEGARRLRRHHLRPQALSWRGARHAGLPVDRRWPPEGGAARGLLRPRHQRLHEGP